MVILHAILIGGLTHAGLSAPPLHTDPSTTTRRPHTRVANCVDQRALDQEIDRLIGNERYLWPTNLDYRVEPGSGGEWVLIETEPDGSSNTLGPFSGDCETVVSLISNTVFSQLLSFGIHLESLDTSADPDTNPPEPDLEPLEDETAEIASREREVQPQRRPPRNPPPSMTVVAQGRTKSRAPWIHPALEVGAGYGALPTHAAREDGHAIELVPRFSLVRPGAFSVGIGVRNYFPVSYLEDHDSIFGELVACQVTARTKLDFWFCGSAAYGSIDVPSSDPRNDGRVSASPWLLNLSARLNRWVSPSTAIYLMAGVTATVVPRNDSPRIANTSPVFPSVVIGTTYTFACDGQSRGCRRH